MKTIFVVDDNDVNLAAADNALSNHYLVYTLPSAKGMFDLLGKIRPDMILLDILMPEIDGFETMKLLKEKIEWEDIPVIFLTGRKDASTESLGLEMGAVDFISKPFSGPVLLNRIKIHLDIEDKIRERTDSLRKLKNGIVSVLANMVENRDRMTGSHIERTTGYISLIIKSMFERKVYLEEISQWDLDLAISSARLHDLGKIAIPDLILNKPDKLTADEFNSIKTHVAEGEKIIDIMITETGDRTFLHYAKLFAGYHHERWDGTGYPYGLKGVDIPLQGRIMALVDVYDALVSSRPYKKAYSHEEALEYIRENSGIHFDPELVKVFIASEEEIRKMGVE